MPENMENSAVFTGLQKVSFLSNPKEDNAKNVQAGFRKGRGTRDLVANIHGIIEKTRKLQKNICFIDYAKAIDYVDHNKLWKILKEMRILDHLTCLKIKPLCRSRSSS